MQILSAPCCGTLKINETYCPDQSHAESSLSNTLNLGLLFFVSIFSKALLLGTLPLAGNYVSNNSFLSTTPILTLMLGWIAASAFHQYARTINNQKIQEISASLGVLGGLLCVYSIIEFSLSGLSLSAFLIGIAQGAGFFIRHQAMKITAKDQNSKIAYLLGLSALIGLIGPYFTQIFENLFAPQLFIGSLCLATLLHTLSLMLTLAQNKDETPQKTDVKTIKNDQERISLPLKNFVKPTFIAAFAWFFMMIAMTSGPLALAFCGLTSAGVSGAVSWHLCAMFAPNLFIKQLHEKIGVQNITYLGFVMGILSILIIASSTTPSLIITAMIIAGIAWCFTTSGASLWMAENNADKTILFKHDGIIYSAALLGAIAAPIIAAYSL